MMGIKERKFRSLPSNLSLEELVPKDNFYRRLEERLDLVCQGTGGRPLRCDGGH